MMSEARAFRIEADEAKRYGEYVRMAAFTPWTDSDRHIELAVYAWDRGTGPVMVPAYIRRHGRILTTQIARNDWDGSMIGQVDLLIGQPTQFCNGLPGPGDGYWRSWPSEFSFSSDREVFYEPSGEDLARSGYLLASVSLRFPIPTSRLPQPHPDGADIDTCKRAVGVLVDELNAIVGPVIARIEGS